MMTRLLHLILNRVMERVVKFRGKRVSNGEWLYGDLMHDNTGGCYIYPLECDNLYKENAVLPESVGQFTGLHDYKGREIYEGDVLFVREWENLAMRVFDHEEREQFSLEECKGSILHESQRVVCFEEGSMCAGDYYISTLWDKQDKQHQYPIFEVEIIGNIHDNPNLSTDGND